METVYSVLRVSKDYPTNRYILCTWYLGTAIQGLWEWGYTDDTFMHANQPVAALVTLFSHDPGLMNVFASNLSKEEDEERNPLGFFFFPVA